MSLKNIPSLNIYNGAIYQLLEPFVPSSAMITILVDGDPVTLHSVKFEGLPCPLGWDDIEAEFTFGYACTVHKAQGSEWNNVVLFDEMSRRNKPDDYKRWIYTGITRATTNVIIVAGSQG